MNCRNCGKPLERAKPDNNQWMGKTLKYTHDLKYSQTVFTCTYDITGEYVSYNEFDHYFNQIKNEYASS